MQQNSAVNHISRIILKFFGVYIILFAAYRFLILRTQPDFLTLQTAKQTNLIYCATGYDTHWEVMQGGSNVGIFENGRWVVNIIEGCNSASVIILFLAFVWAFPAPWKERLWFSSAGTVLIWTANLFRIWVLGLIYLHHKDWFDIMHRVFFPAIIYGTVVLLWIIWVRQMMRRGVV